MSWESASSGFTLAAGVSLVLSFALVGLVRAYALRAGVLDTPNERSSHSAPTPRGGGLGVIASLLATAVLGSFALAAFSASLLTVFVAIAAVAAVGWADDHRPLPVAPRLLVHLAAGAAVAWLAVGGVGGQRGLIVAAAWVACWTFWTASAINVVNFMDGIDGLIGSQIALYAGYVAIVAPPGSYVGVFAAALAGAALGFLPWNWAPAKIFLGDVGSGALGLAACVAGALVCGATGSGVVPVFLPLLPLFLDATATLVRRARRGERITTAHRSHLYQRLANGGWGHARVSLLYLIAAAVGAAVGLLARGSAAPACWALYAASVAALGWLLERRLRAPERSKRVSAA